jgi:hypothetical protein
MGEIEELRRRLEALEARLDEVAEQQAATRHLAVNSDRGMAALREQRRADVQLMQALRTTQLEHSSTLRELGATVGVLLTGQIELARVQDKHTEKLDRLTTAVDAIVRHLGITPEQRTDE